jgi:hypothetical protein
VNPPPPRRDLIAQMMWTEEEFRELRLVFETAVLVTLAKQRQRSFPSRVLRWWTGSDRNELYDAGWDAFHRRDLTIVKRRGLMP